jgi:hypothetical protein
MPVTMDPSVTDYVSSFARIEALQAEARELLLRIQDLYSEIGEIANGGVVRRGRPRGRPRGARRGPGRPRASGRRRGRPRGARRGPGRPPGPAGRRAAGVTRGKGRAKRGALKEAIHKVLAGGKVIRPADIVKQLPKVGYKTSSKPRVFYTNVYLALKRDKAIKKMGKDGFRLR